MEVYVALTSLKNMIDLIQNHPRPPISLPDQQVGSLTRLIASLQNILEKSGRIVENNMEEGDGLMRVLADTTYEAEDAIDSLVADQIQAESTRRHGENIDSSNDVYQQLQRAVTNMEAMALCLNTDYEMLRITSMDMSMLVLGIYNHVRYFVPPSYFQQLQLLVEKFIFVKEFLSRHLSDLCQSKEGNDFVSRIGKVSFNANYVLILNQYRDGSTSDGREYFNSIEFHQGLQQVMEDMDSIKNQMIEIQERMRVVVQHQLNTTMVGFDDASFEILDKLIGGQLGRQIIPITGMGGIGKTTLAQNIYADPRVKTHFDVRAWISISQEYSTQQILRNVLCQVNPGREGSSQMDENEIGEGLYKYLFGRRYLIIMDDMWNIEAWEKVQSFFPECKGSRIVVTTRNSNLAHQLNNSYVHDMKFLDEVASWDLFSQIVFPKNQNPDGPPHYLEEIGKKIVRKCRGLPLSIVVIGGLLAKSYYTSEYWKQMEEDLNSIVSSEYEQCLNILLMSYNVLPVHLKPCFLYMGVFKNDSPIPISKLVKLWVAEGFLKPVSGQDMEEVAKQYLQDLVDRNLVLVQKDPITSRAKRVSIHDLLRDFCLRRAKQERFYSVLEQDAIHSQRRFILSGDPLQEEGRGPLLSMPLARSLICSSDQEAFPSLDLRLLRVFEASCAENFFFSQENAFQLFNLRYIAVPTVSSMLQIASWNHLWSLQTLIVYGSGECFEAPPAIWSMHQLQHVQVQSSLYLPNPPIGSEQEDLILENLQTLVRVRDFNCSKELAKRIPNVKKLAVEYSKASILEECDLSFDRLDKLNSFEFSTYCIDFSEPISATGFLERLTFPVSIMKMCLHFSSVVQWDDILEKIGSLPLLEKLELRNGTFRRGTWETVEDRFPKLKVLKIFFCEGLTDWISESSHFSCLEHLHLSGLLELKEIPLDFGDSTTLRLLELNECSDSSVVSAKTIQEAQVDYHGKEGALRVKVILSSNQVQSQRFSEGCASPIFDVLG